MNRLVRWLAKEGYSPKKGRCRDEALLDVYASMVLSKIRRTKRPNSARDHEAADELPLALLYELGMILTLHEYRRLRREHPEGWYFV